MNEQKHTPPLQLGAIQETMLIPVTIKATETQRKNARIKDYTAVKILETLQCDTSKYDKFMSHEGVIARTIMFDREAAAFIAAHPDCTVLNLACGLDDRFSRVDNGTIRWFDLDLADSMAVRRQFFSDTDRRKMLTGSVLDTAWVTAVKSSGNYKEPSYVLIIIEGLLMYLTEAEVKETFDIIADFFPEAQIITELMCRATAGFSKHHDTVKHTGAVFRWGIDNGTELEELCPKLKLLKEESFNLEMSKYTFRGWLFGNLPKFKRLNNRLAVFGVKAYSPTPTVSV